MVPRLEPRTSRSPSAAPSEPSLDSPAIDALYGLEPVFDPETSRRDATLGENIGIRCPYCGEPIDVEVDLTAGARSYIEDCAVCCHPIEHALRFSAKGRFEGLTSTRIDG